MRSRGLCALALVVAWLTLHALPVAPQIGPPSGGVLKPWATSVTVTPSTVLIREMIAVEAVFSSQAPLSSVTARVECPGLPTGATMGMMMPDYGSLGTTSGGMLSQKWKGQSFTPLNATAQNLTCSVSFDTRLGSSSFSVAGSSLALLRDEGTPQILGFAVTPTTMPADGGLVTVRVTATDDGGIASSIAYVTQPTGQMTGVRLSQEPTAPGMPAGSSTWRVSWTIPRNTATTPATWGIKASVTDIVGRAVATQPATLTVAGRAPAQERPRAVPSPPGPPRPGPLPAK